MEAMNKWLAFSLSGAAYHHAEPPSTTTSHPDISDWNTGIGAAGEADSRRNQYTSASSLSENQLSMNIISQHYEQPEAPKLENFLGQYNNHRQGYNIASNYNPISDDNINNRTLLGTDNNPNNDNNNNASNSTIGLSMIKSWLRNNQTLGPSGPPHHGHNNNNNNNNLSLSMGSEAGPLSLLAPTIVSQGEDSSQPSDHDRDNGNNDDGDKVQQDSQNSSSSCAIEAVPRRSLDTFGQRTSIYRGVTRHRWTGRYEAHLWDNSCRREGQTRKGRQVYLGGYDKEEKAARAYDLAALKYWGTTTTTNFPISNYEKELEEMKHMTRQEFVASLRRKSSGFSRGASIYRGVTRHHQHGRWQARIGRVAGNKDLYLGTFSTQEEAAEAYDIAAIKFRGLNAVTNFDMNRYDVKSILESTTLPIGAAKRPKEITGQANISSTILHEHDFPRLANPYENDAAASAVATVLTGINSYGHLWPSSATMGLPFYGYGRAPQSSNLGCKQEQRDQETDHDPSSDRSRYVFGSGFGASTTHDFFQPLVPNYNLVGSASVSNPELQALSATYLTEYGYGSDHAAAYGNYQHSTVDGINGWVPTAIPTGDRSSSSSNTLFRSNMSHDVPGFTVWPE